MLGEAAKGSGVVTQMGNQGTALSNLRESAALIRNGVVGDVKEVHVWTNRPVWPQSFGLKVKEETPPKNVHWNEWIGARQKCVPTAQKFIPLSGVDFGILEREPLATWPVIR